MKKIFLICTALFSSLSIATALNTPESGETIFRFRVVHHPFYCIPNIPYILDSKAMTNAVNAAKGTTKTRLEFFFNDQHYYSSPLGDVDIEEISLHELYQFNPNVDEALKQKIINFFESKEMQSFSITHQQVGVSIMIDR